MSRIRNHPGVEWCVWIERTSSTSGHGRIFQSRPPAEAFMRRLLSGGRPDLAPLRYVALERRDVGQWETVAEDSETEAIPKRKRLRAVQKGRRRV